MFREQIKVAGRKIFGMANAAIIKCLKFNSSVFASPKFV
jgi:hypothetical protein